MFNGLKSDIAKKVVERLLDQVDIHKLLDKIITPENIEAAARGIGYGIAKGLKDGNTKT